MQPSGFFTTRKGITDTLGVLLKWKFNEEPRKDQKLQLPAQGYH